MNTLREEDSLFEQIMKLKRATIVQRNTKNQPKQLKTKPKGRLSEIEIRYNQLVEESADRRTSHERVLQIRRELTEIRRIRRERN
jgi:hypothetical protein